MIHTSIWLAALMALAVITSSALRPTHLISADRPPVHLAEIIPRSLADWHEEEGGDISIVNPQAVELANRLYSDVLNRTYVNSRGLRIMLSIAYGQDQRREDRLHIPDVCYPAGGFDIKFSAFGMLKMPNAEIRVKRLVTVGRGRTEPLTYWIVIGDRVVQRDWSERVVELRYGLRGQIADGLIARVSSLSSDSEMAFIEQASFVNDLYRTLAPAYRDRIFGRE